jgi:hypothetical protein
VPIRFSLDPQLNILITTADGLVTFDDIQNHLEQEEAQGLLDCREIFDANGASTDLSGDQARQIVARLKVMARHNRIGPTAIVTDNNVFFGMAMMIKILSEVQDGPQVAVFRTFEAGLDWLTRRATG